MPQGESSRWMKTSLALSPSHVLWLVIDVCAIITPWASLWEQSSLPFVCFYSYLFPDIFIIFTYSLVLLFFLAILLATLPSFPRTALSFLCSDNPPHQTLCIIFVAGIIAIMATVVISAISLAIEGFVWEMDTCGEVLFFK